MEYFFMYMLRCADESFYIGHTDNLNKRIAEHQAGAYCCYTKSRLPIEVVYVQTFTSRYEALVAERKIKGWRRAKKEALIKADWNEISRLASRRKDCAVAQGPSFETQAKPAPQDER